MFRNMIFSSTLAGLLAALVLTLTQALWVTPLILQAETYENAAEPAPADSAAAHHHDAAAWAPEDGWQRTLSTGTSNGLLGIGFALILTSLYALRRPTGAVQGLAWGLAGFAVFFAAPGLGLPPELPGTEAADLTARQLWWLGTAASTAVGLALLFLQSRWSLRGVAIALLIAPHLIGAPHPAVEQSLAPAALQLNFRLATLATNVAFWLLLGVISALIYQRFSREASQ